MEESSEKEKQPWWNDQDKMGGLIATSLCIIVLGFVAILAWRWAWHLAFN